ncbi:hypothetical protein [Burkholderia sp. BCC0405]|uniref:hypothetical protein n=1 Tax=Burkholderia sp. BCC0405 TaxID=2676298 RepID=UPI00158BF5DC|nr:hypothetical protein [Burkholderia sp. BCC0405]
MTNFIFANNIDTTLASAISNTSTTITLASTANLPSSIPAGYVLVITLNDAATQNNYEVLYATSISGATLTVMRAQEGTSALSWLIGDYAFSGPTAGQQGSFGQLSTNNSWTGANAFTQPVSVANAVSAPDAVALGQFIYGSNGNGAYWVLPGGAQLCRFQLIAPANGSATWTFPLSFVSAPQVFYTTLGPSNPITEAMWLTGVGITSATIFNPNSYNTNINLIAVL